MTSAPPSPPRSRSRLWTSVALLILAVWGLRQTIAADKKGELRPFFIYQGQSTREVARKLEAEKFIARHWNFLVWAKVERRPPKPGRYMLSDKMSARQIYKRLIAGPPVIRITLPEGWSSRQMAALLEQNAVTSAQEFLRIVDEKKLEGYLFPDTYFFEQGLPAQQVVQRLQKRFDEVVPADFAAKAKALKLTERQLVTLASLVEKEARIAAERPLIAGVYLNRIRKRMRLEADPTVQYALGEWKSRLTYQDLDVQSPYNTYRHAGLPPGPIASPGLDSLKAAANPQKSDYLFFFADGTGAHIFSRTYQEHLDRQKSLKKQQKAAKRGA
jgi:UPF0755 protein